MPQNHEIGNSSNGFFDAVSAQSSVSAILDLRQDHAAVKQVTILHDDRTIGIPETR